MNSKWIDEQRAAYAPYAFAQEIMGVMPEPAFVLASTLRVRQVNWPLPDMDTTKMLELYRKKTAQALGIRTSSMKKLKL